MSEPQDPHSGQYPQYPGYPPPQGGYGYQPAQPARPEWRQRLLRRPAPRFGVTITGVGIALAIVGIVVWGLTYIIDGISQGVAAGGSPASSDSRRFLGFALALVVVAVGYGLVVTARTGPLVTAGVAATALGVPVAMEFATLDVSSGQPVDTAPVVWVSVAVYLISYFFVRGARGHSFYLGAALLLVWEYAIEQSLPSATALGRSVISPFTGTTTVPPIDTATLAATSLVLAVGYFLVAWALDHTGRAGAAVPFVVVGVPAMLVGIVALAPHAKQGGTGVVLALVGLVLSGYGARYGRRFTAWFWGLASAAGVVVIVADVAKQGTSAGLGLIVLGLVFVVGGWVAANAFEEPDDMAGVATERPAAPGLHTAP
jgi:hypothetical protein